MLIDIHARDIVQLRESSRQLEAMLAELEQIARTNDRILLTLHKLSLLLIAKPAHWRKTAVALLTKQFSLPHGELLVFGEKDAKRDTKLDNLAKAVARLPVGGKGGSEPLPGTDAVAGMKRYFYLPLKKNGKGGRVCGVLVFASKKADAFSDTDARDFMQRLAELLAAAL